jgi:hypothetical protein
MKSRCCNLDKYKKVTGSYPGLSYYSGKLALRYIPQLKNRDKYDTQVGSVENRMVVDQNLQS